MPIEVEADRACQHSEPDDTSTVCGAAVATDERCLVHLSPDARAAWLAALDPEADIDARGVRFSGDLLSELLGALVDPVNGIQFGTADFRMAIFDGTAPFAGVTFSGDAVFERATFKRDAEFGGATFCGDAWFGGAMFAGDAWFGEATFKSEAWFYGMISYESARFGTTDAKDMPIGGATFTGEALFNEATFSGMAWFTNTTFNGVANFEGAHFNDSAWLGGATFNEGILCYHTEFTQDVSCNGAKFAGDTWFESVTFGGRAEFDSAAFTGDAWFSDAVFNSSSRFGDVSFTLRASFDGAVVQNDLLVEGIANRVTMRGLRGNGRISLRLRAGAVDLTDVVLAGPLSVHGLDQSIDGGDEAGANGGGKPPNVRVASVRGSDASTVTFTDVDLSRCRFAGLHRADQIVLDGQCVFADGPHGRRRVLAEEHHWRAIGANGPGGQPQQTSRWRLLPELDGERSEVVGPARLEVLYRQLRKALEDAKNEPGAADFYYGEMEMRRLGTHRRAERCLLGLYWAVSGYGLRARRALAWLALLIILSVGGLTWLGFPQTAMEQKASGSVVTPAGRQPITLSIRQVDPVTALPDRAEKATEITLNAVVFRSPDAELTTLGRYLNIATRILGPLLLGLAILAVRNQVKR